jgi:hypothetical protein
MTAVTVGARQDFAPPYRRPVAVCDGIGADKARHEA